MHAYRLVLVCLLIASLSGCVWQPAVVPGHDPERAREILTTALEAWKNGNVQALATQTPPIRFQDDDLVSGCKLIGYEMMDSKIIILPFKNVTVNLDLENPQGKRQRRKAAYQVGLQPFLSVQRSDN